MSDTLGKQDSRYAISILVSVLAFARDLARLGDPGLLLEVDLVGEGFNIGGGDIGGCDLFLDPNGRPRLGTESSMIVIASVFSGSSRSLPVCLGIFLALLADFLPVSLRSFPSLVSGGLCFKGLPDIDVSGLVRLLNGCDLGVGRGRRVLGDN